MTTIIVTGGQRLRTACASFIPSIVPDTSVSTKSPDVVVPFQQFDGQIGSSGSVGVEPGVLDAAHRVQEKKRIVLDDERGI